MINVFLVEDHAVVRKTLTTFLEREPDMKVCGEAASGPEALERLKDLKPDLVLLDVSLPGIDGISLLEEIRSRWPGLPCIILSGHAESVYRQQAEAAGALSYIDKKAVKELVPTIRKALTQK